jgi:crotonobetainyl-CoA:carnitine CoA-transferase CaiB-like acyl-CoA transferase
VLGLVADADVLIEGFRPGVAEQSLLPTTSLRPVMY